MKIKYKNISFDNVTAFQRIFDSADDPNTFCMNCVIQERQEFLTKKFYNNLCSLLKELGSGNVPECFSLIDGIFTLYLRERQNKLKTFYKEIFKIK